MLSVRQGRQAAVIEEEDILDERVGVVFKINCPFRYSAPSKKILDPLLIMSLGTMVEGVSM